MTTLRIWVVAALSAVRRKLEKLVLPPLVVIGSSPPGPATWLEMSPDVVLWEAEPEEIPSLQAPSEPPWVVLTSPPAALAGPVRGLLTREPSADQVGAALMAAARGLVCLEPSFREEPAASQGRGPALTPRERQVLESLAAGMANKEIAQTLGVSEHTVKFHLGSLFSKLEVATRTEAVTAGLRQGLVML